MTAIHKIILTSLAYSDIFDFPLTKEELWQFLIHDNAVDRKEFDKALKDLPKEIVSKGGYFALSNNASIIKARKKNQDELQKKLRLAKRAAYYLSYIPTIKLIGISGGVAMGKAALHDDIDLFIITQKNTLFMTRIWIQAILEILNLRRERGTNEASDKICVNLLIDETELTWAEKNRDVYTAHEITQMKPLFERNEMYKNFIKQNEWVTGYFPNAFEILPNVLGSSWKRNYKSLGIISSVLMLQPFEKLVAFLQKRHMKAHQTTEIVTEHYLAFHPFDYRINTMTHLNDRMRQLGLLTNK